MQLAGALRKVSASRLRSLLVFVFVACQSVPVPPETSRAPLTPSVPSTTAFASPTATPGGTESLATAPIAGRSSHSAVWTGKEMIVWGGVTGWSLQPTADGAAYDPATDSWRLLRPAPIGPRFGHAAVWAGSQMIVWGGADSEDGQSFNDGAAYDPVADRWGPVLTAPVTGRFFHSAVWTGTEMLIWGGRTEGTEDVGVALNPVDNTWREFPAGPLRNREQHSAVWTGDAMVIWAGVLSGSEALADDGARYDVATESWTTLPDAPLLGRYGHASAWTGTDMYVWGGTYGSHYAMPDGALYDPLGDAWSRLAPFPLVGRYGHSAIWTGLELIIWGGRNGTDLEPVARGVSYDPMGVRWRGEIDASGGVVSEPDAAGNVVPPPPPSFAFVECARFGVPQNVGEVNTNLDLESGLLDLSLVIDGEDTDITVSLFDPTCLNHPVIGPIIESELTDAIADLQSECADWQARLEAGQTIVRGQPVDPSAVRAFIEQWCS